MPEQVTVDQMNEVIALFMGGSSIKNHSGKRYVYYPKSCAKDVAELKYHSSWDWLMPVVEKINTLKEWKPDGKDLSLFSRLTVHMELCGSYKKGRCHILGSITLCHTDNIPHTYTERELPGISINLKKTLIEAVYEAVYQFIQWYNQNKQQ